MEATQDYLYHLVPLLLISGLGGGQVLGSHPLEINGEPLAVRPKAIDHPVALDIKGRFAAKANDLKIVELLALKASRKKLNHLLNIQFIDDTYRLIPVKRDGKYPDGQRHSILSPRNPHSKLYPDGLFDALWIQKYLYIQPAMTISFHIFGDTSTDEALIQDLVKLKSQWAKRDTKFVAVVIGENIVSEERISNLRRATGLEKRTGLFYVPSSYSQVEKETFVEQLCQMAYNQGLEFYANLSKNIKKKIGNHHVRNDDDETSGNSISSLPLTSAGWEARYSIKIAALCEFRQDLDASLKAHETAYDNVIELLEATTSRKSKRWNETVEIADYLAQKMIKICIYIDQPNLGYRKFLSHLNAISDFSQRNEGFDLSLWRAKQFLKLAQYVESTGDLTISKKAPMAGGIEDLTPRLPRCGNLYLSAVELMRESDAFDLEEPIFDALRKAKKDLSQDPVHQRSVAYALYRQGEALIAKEDFESALTCLKDAATIYRRDSYGPILKEILRLIVKCAGTANKTEDSVRATIELNVLSGQEIDLTQISEQEVKGYVSPFSAHFAFGASEFHVGIPSNSQLALSCSRDWTIDKLSIVFSGLPDIELKHSDIEGSFFGQDETNLSFNNNQKVYQLTHIPKDLGDARILRLTAESTFGGVKYLYKIPLSMESNTFQWRSHDETRRRRIQQPHFVHIAPRPPRIKLSTSNVGTAAAGETLNLILEVLNEEEETINLELKCAVSTNEGKPVEVITDVDKVTQEPELKQYAYKIHVPVAGATGMTIDFGASYTLVSDDTVIKDSLYINVAVAKPFRVNFNVLPRLHPEHWPSSFIPHDSVSHAPLIKKRWELIASMLFLGESKVIVLGSELTVDPVNTGEAHCDIIEQPADQQLRLGHNEGSKMSFTFDISRGEREVRSVAAEAHLRLKWKRETSDEINTYEIPVVRLSLPLYEPRAIVVGEAQGRFIKLRYFIENATSHILTYSVTMSSSDEFGFEGPKDQSLRALPYTRRSLEYILLPTAQGWLKLPNLRIHDTYFKRTLLIVSANEFVRADKNELYVKAP